MDGELNLDESLGIVGEAREFFPDFLFGNQASFELSNKPFQFNQDFLVPLCIIFLALL